MNPEGKDEALTVDSGDAAATGDDAVMAQLEALMNDDGSTAAPEEETPDEETPEVVAEEDNEESEDAEEDTEESEKSSEEKSDKSEKSLKSFKDWQQSKK